MVVQGPLQVAKRKKAMATLKISLLTESYCSFVGIGTEHFGSQCFLTWL